MTIHTDLTALLPEGVRRKPKKGRVYWELRRQVNGRRVDTSLRGIEGELTADLLIAITGAVEAIRGGVQQPAKPAGRQRADSTNFGTWGLAWANYQTDEDFGWQLLDPKTQRYYRVMAEQWLDSQILVDDPKTWKELTIAETSQGAILAYLKHVKAGAFNGGKRPAQSQARKLQTLISRLAKVGMKAGWIKAGNNPCFEMVRVPKTTGKRKSWPAAEMAAYEARWPLGTPERTAYELTKWTGARQGDIVQMRMSSVTKRPKLDAKGKLTWDRFLMVTIGKGQLARIRTKGEAKVVPVKITPMLEQTVIAFMKPGQDHLLIGARGKPLGAGGMKAFFAKARAAAGLTRHGYSQHGLRSFAASFAGSAGATTHQVAAVLGHEKPNEVTLRYMEEANGFNLSGDALDLVTALVERQAALEKALAAYDAAGGTVGVPHS
jgi:integrase